MKFCTRFILIVSVVVVSYLYKKYRDIATPLPIPSLNLNSYWGPGVPPNKENTSIRPFKVEYSAEIIDKLINRLNDYDFFTPSLEGINFEYGFNSNELKKIVAYWKNDYLPKWKEHQAFLNQFSQFKTNIQGLDIHYIHVKPTIKTNKKVYPIVLLHGWPGSVREFYEVINLLTEPSDNDFTFEVVVPSLPGYGWSQGSAKTEMGTDEIAIIMRNLMLRIGYDKFFVQGGDWGSLIGSNLAAFFPNNVLGYHSNACNSMSNLATLKSIIASYYPSYFIEDEKLIELYYPFLPKALDLVRESGYMHIQATKPDTIGAALSNNPVGLAAYILEKFSTWTNPSYKNLANGGLDKYFKIDALLDNVMIYYLSNSITTSVRLYSEGLSIRESTKELHRIHVLPPSGCLKFRNELVHQLDWILRDKFVNLIHSNHHSDGGHFAALQLPQVFYNDLIEFVAAVNI